MKRAVIVICDGHRDDFVKTELCPAITALEKQGRRFSNHYGIYPSATRASVASFATGCWPMTHGLQGNTMAIDGGAGLVMRDSGMPDIFDHMRDAFGRTLKTPTMAARLAAATGSAESAFVISNGSPGAARFHDPDHATYVYNRAGCFAPGGVAIADDPQLTLGKDGAADRSATERFCNELESGSTWQLAVLWLCEPDTTMHATVLGSDTHKLAIAGADACVGEVAKTVEALRGKGQDILFMVGSDHGQETVAKAIPLEQLLIDARLKESSSSTDVVVAPQGSAAHIYVAKKNMELASEIEAFCRDHAWCGALLAGDALRPTGQAPVHELALSISMRKYAEPNELGVPGVTDVVTSDAKPAKPKGYGSHGGLGAYERKPFLIATGGGMATGSVETGQTSLVNIAPTVLRHLGVGRQGMDGIALSHD